MTLKIFLYPNLQCGSIASWEHATIDFGIDAIASIQWSGQARTIRRLAAPTDTAGTWSGSLTGTYVPKELILDIASSTNDPKGHSYDILPSGQYGMGFNWVLWQVQQDCNCLLFERSRGETRRER